MAEDGLAVLDTIEGNGVFLHNLDGNRLGRCEVPDLLALPVRILEKLSDLACAMRAHSFAQMEALRNYLGEGTPGSISVSKSHEYGATR